MNLWTLIGKNLFRRPLRHGLVLATVAAAAGMALAGSLLEGGARRGYEQTMARLGADLVAVPDEMEAAVERAYLSGEVSAVYMEAGVKEKIASFDFVAQTSAQLFIQSLSNAACCSAGNIFLIGFEPESDFTIRPWLATHPDRPLGPNEVLVGADFILAPGDTVRFYGHEFTVAGVLEPAGSALDRSCFLPLPTAYLMAEESARKAVEKLEIKRDQISAVMIRLKPEAEGGLPLEEAAYRLNRGIYEVTVIEPQKVWKRIHHNLAGPLWALRAAGWALWPMTALLMGLIFAETGLERRRELGLLRALGATRVHLSFLLMAEALILAGVGGVVGAGSAAAFLAGFCRLIAFHLEVPFLLPSGAAVLGAGLKCLGVALAAAGTGVIGPAVYLAWLEPYAAARKSD